MSDDLEQRREVLRGLLAKVPSRVLAAGSMVTGQYLKDASKAQGVLGSDKRWKINSAIEILEVWHRGEIPHFHQSFD